MTIATRPDYRHRILLSCMHNPEIFILTPGKSLICRPDWYRASVSCKKNTDDLFRKLVSNQADCFFLYISARYLRMQFDDLRHFVLIKIFAVDMFLVHW